MIQRIIAHDYLESDVGRQITKGLVWKWRHIVSRALDPIAIWLEKRARADIVF